jgi:hypothetical protein
MKHSFTSSEITFRQLILRRLDSYRLSNSKKSIIINLLLTNPFANHFRFDNSEHEVIAGIIASLGPTKSCYPRYSNGSPKIKLRYIKLLYPEVDEAVLFDLLYNYDHNSQEVMIQLEKMGYQKRNISKGARKKFESIKSLDLKSLQQKKTMTLTSLHFSTDVSEKQKGI